MSSVRNDQCLKEEIKRRKKKRMKLPRLSSSSPPSDIEISDSLNILHFNLANYSRRKKQNTYYAKHPFIRRRQWFNERLIREYRSPRRRKSSCLDFLIKKRMSKTHTHTHGDWIVSTRHATNQLVEFLFLATSICRLAVQLQWCFASESDVVSIVVFDLISKID